jgi:pantothenate kinase
MEEPAPQPHDDAVADARGLDPASVALKLAIELRARLAASERLMLGIAGAPGSGKSTLAHHLASSFEPGFAIVVPMDGFHLANRIIEDTPLQHRKGAIDTFDVDGYVVLLERLARNVEPVVYAPSYWRGLEEPIAASIAVPKNVRLVITEGNYLLVDNPRWQDARSMLEDVWYVETPHERRLSRLIARHVESGMDQEAAERWANGPDEANARLVETTKFRASRVIDWP